MNSEFRTFRSFASFKKVAIANNLKVKLVSKSKNASYFQAITQDGVIVGFFCDGPPNWLSIKTTGHIDRKYIAQ